MLFRCYPEHPARWSAWRMESLAAAPAAPAGRDDPTIWRADDALWALLAPVLRSAKPRTKPGRPRRDDRAIFDGLVWLARTGSQWSRLPGEFGPKSTAHRRSAEWAATGAVERAWAVLLREYDGALGIDWAWQAADGCIVTALFGKRGAPARRRRPAATRPTAARPAPSGTT